MMDFLKKITGLTRQSRKPAQHARSWTCRATDFTLPVSRWLDNPALWRFLHRERKRIWDEIRDCYLCHTQPEPELFSQLDTLDANINRIRQGGHLWQK